MEEKAKMLELAAAAAWKMVSESAGKLSERQEYLKVLKLVAKVLGPSRRAVWAWWKLCYSRHSCSQYSHLHPGPI
jgi:hypothetical protein